MYRTFATSVRTIIVLIDCIFLSYVAWNVFNAGRKIVISIPRRGSWTYLGKFGVLQVLVVMIVIVEDVGRQRDVTTSHLIGKGLLSLHLHLLIVRTKIGGCKM